MQMRGENAKKRSQASFTKAQGLLLCIQVRETKRRGETLTLHSLPTLSLESDPSSPHYGPTTVGCLLACLPARPYETIRLCEWTDRTFFGFLHISCWCTHPWEAAWVGKCFNIVSLVAYNQRLLSSTSDIIWFFVWGTIVTQGGIL